VRLVGYLKEEKKDVSGSVPQPSHFNLWKEFLIATESEAWWAPLPHWRNAKSLAAARNETTVHHLSSSGPSQYINYAIPAPAI